MIELKNLSPSAIKCYQECPMKFFASYGLRYYVPTKWHSTVLGTAAHHVLELIAEAKILKRDNKSWKKDDVVERIYSDKYPLDEWTTQCYNYYTKQNSHLEWEDSHLVELKRRLKACLDDEWSPMNIAPEDMIQAELLVETPFDQEWAKPFTDQNGKLHKHLLIKGFVDLVYKVDGKIIFLDHKSGARAPSCFKTRKKKGYKEHLEDIQMLIYWWSVKKTLGECAGGRIFYFGCPKPVKYELPIDDDYFKSAIKQIGDIYNDLKTKKGFSRVCTEDKWTCLRLCPFSTMNMGDIGREDLNINHSHNRDFFSGVDGKACICDSLTYFNMHKSAEEIQENCKIKKKSL